MSVCIYAPSPAPHTPIVTESPLECVQYARCSSACSSASFSTSFVSTTSSSVSQQTNNTYHTLSMAFSMAAMCPLSADPDLCYFVHDIHGRPHSVLIPAHVSASNTTQQMECDIVNQIIRSDMDAKRPLGNRSYYSVDVISIDISYFVMDVLQQQARACGRRRSNASHASSYSSAEAQMCDFLVAWDLMAWAPAISHMCAESRVLTFTEDKWSTYVHEVPDALRGSYDSIPSLTARMFDCILSVLAETHGLANLHAMVVATIFDDVCVFVHMLFHLCAVPLIGRNAVTFDARNGSALLKCADFDVDAYSKRSPMRRLFSTSNLLSTLIVSKESTRKMVKSATTQYVRKLVGALRPTTLKAIPGYGVWAQQRSMAQQ